MFLTLSQAWTNIFTARTNDTYITKAHKMEKYLSDDRVVCVGRRQRVEKIGESMATCGFSYMGQRGARGQSLRASWQWQHQCQTLEEERTCMMVSPKLWRYGSMASLLGLRGPSSFTKFKFETVTISPLKGMVGCGERLLRPIRGQIPATNNESASDLFRADISV